MSQATGEVERTGTGGKGFGYVRPTEQRAVTGRNDYEEFE